MVTLKKAVEDKLIRPTSGLDKSYEFQVNLHFTEKQVSACGLGPDGCICAFARSLSGLLTRIKKVTGLQLHQIKLTFQPE
jgi:hypothetical protein